MKIERPASLLEVPRDDWAGLGSADQPFQDHRFLCGLEQTGCVGQEQGWEPEVLLIREGGELLAGCVSYRKVHSQGEFVYDWSWAEFSERNGLPYYPKRVLVSPFSPVGGERLLVRRGLDAERGRALKIRLLHELLRQEPATSGLHVLFPTSEESRLLDELGLFTRHAWQYHWIQEGYASWDEYLASFRSKKRKAVRRERRLVEEQGYRVVARRGHELDEKLVRWLFEFYLSTCDRYPWGRAYLNLAFFQHLVREMPEHVVAFLAWHEDDDADTPPTAGAFCLYDSTTLYGRYWGARVEVPYLHFETCIHQPIQWCIEHGLQRFEPGAGGEHKYARGLTPTLTTSNHFLAHPLLHQALRAHTERESRQVLHHIEELRNHQRSPSPDDQNPHD